MVTLFFNSIPLVLASVHQLELPHTDIIERLRFITTLLSALPSEAGYAVGNRLILCLLQLYQYVLDSHFVISQNSQGTTQTVLHMVQTLLPCCVTQGRSILSQHGRALARQAVEQLHNGDKRSRLNDQLVVSLVFLVCPG